MKSLFNALVLFLTFATGAVHAQDVLTSLAGKPVGKVYFSSITPKNLYELQRRAAQQPPAKVAGTLYLPGSLQTPVAAMVISAGSGGIMSNQTDRWKPLFLNMGMAVFIIDTLGSRGIANTVSDQGQLS